MHVESSFITLTYADEFLPKGGTLSVEDCQLFLKRLRARISPTRIKFFLAGEYGDKLSRPHYHAIIFGYSFPDKVLMASSGPYQEFHSPMLTEAWGKGLTHVGSVTFDSASYVANYATKKVTGKKAESYYQGRKPEFVLMSRGGRSKGGIGRSFIEKFASDVYPVDEVIVKGNPCKPPRYYDTWLESSDGACFERVKARREEESDVLEARVGSSGVVELHHVVGKDQTAARLAVREKVARAKAALKSRKLEGA